MSYTVRMWGWLNLPGRARFLFEPMQAACVGRIGVGDQFDRDRTASRRS